MPRKYEFWFFMCYFCQIRNRPRRRSMQKIEPNNSDKTQQAPPTISISSVKRLELMLKLKLQKTARQKHRNSLYPASFLQVINSTISAAHHFCQPCLSLFLQALVVVIFDHLQPGQRFHFQTISNLHGLGCNNHLTYLLGKRVYECSFKKMSYLFTPQHALALIKNNFIITFYFFYALPLCLYRRVYIDKRILIQISAQFKAILMDSFVPCLLHMNKNNSN